MDSFKLLRNGPIGANGEIIAPTALESASVAFLCRVPARGQQIGRALVQAALLFQRSQCSRRNFRRKTSTATQIFLSTTVLVHGRAACKESIAHGSSRARKMLPRSKKWTKKVNNVAGATHAVALNHAPLDTGTRSALVDQGSCGQGAFKSNANPPPLGVGNSGRSLRFTRRLVLLCQK